MMTTTPPLRVIMSPLYCANRVQRIPEAQPLVPVMGSRRPKMRAWQQYWACGKSSLHRTFTRAGSGFHQKGNHTTSELVLFAIPYPGTFRHQACSMSTCHRAGSIGGNSTRLDVGAGGLGGSALGSSGMGSVGAGGCQPCIDVTQQCQQVRWHHYMAKFRSLAEQSCEHTSSNSHPVSLNTCASLLSFVSSTSNRRQADLHEGPYQHHAVHLEAAPLLISMRMSCWDALK